MREETNSEKEIQ